MQILPYSSEMKTEWDECVRRSLNGTFLFCRDFMDYHADRFSDASLMVMHKGKTVALFPASSDGTTVTSHGGLTYGGLLLTAQLSSEQTVEAYQMTAAHYALLGHSSLIVKPIPHIYAKQPAEEERYALFRLGAVQAACGLSSAINLRNPLPMHTLRTRLAKKASRNNLQISCSNEYIPQFHNILTETLATRHGVAPVHTVEEMQLLARRFPDNIRLHTVFHNGKLVAGTWLFATKRVLHAQYIAANDEGRSLGALDFLFDSLIRQHSQSGNPANASGGFDYFDFGISTEGDGHYLNTGLLNQKSGFGARGIVYDKWQIQLTALGQREPVQV